MKKLIIHAGFHRCASTTVQDLLRRNRSAIEASGGALLLRENLAGLLTGRQLRLLYRHAGGNTASRVRLALVSRMFRRMKADRILVSEELLLGLMPGVVPGTGFYPGFTPFLKAMSVLSEQFDIHLRFIARRPDRFLESAYAFRVARGLRCSFPDFVASIGADNVRWLPLVQAAEKAGLAGQTRIGVLEALPPSGDAVLQFLGLSDISDDCRTFPKGNKSPDNARLKGLLGPNAVTGFTNEERAAFLAAGKKDNDAFLTHSIVDVAPGVWAV